MANVTVDPTDFHFVTFDAGVIAKIVGEIADLVGLPSAAEIHVNVDETTPLGRTLLTSVNPITFEIEGGAFENAKAPRQLSERSVRDVAARLLFRAADRLSGRFDDAPPEGEVPLPHNVAWDVHSVGRSARAGVSVSKARRLYHFRNRHGFNDVADAAFETLWNTDEMSWAQIDALVADVAAARVSA